MHICIINVCVWRYIYRYRYILIHTYISIDMYIYVYTCIYINMHRETLVTQQRPNFIMLYSTYMNMKIYV